MKRRGGRRPGPTETREQILTSARRLFGDRGYDSATMREIGADAGVDPAMINHHFGNKEGLFMATIDFPVDPRDYTDAILTGPADQVAERLLRTLLTVWDSPAGTSAAAILRTAMQHEWSVKLLRQLLLTRAIRPIVAALEPDAVQAEWRGNLVAAHLVGVVVSRYILKFEPLAAASRETIVAAMSPSLQRYLTGDVPRLAPR